MIRRKIHQWVGCIGSFYSLHLQTDTYNTATDNLKTLATELQDLVQSKVGATAFSTVYSRIRQNAVTTRNERRVKRVLFAQQPERAEAAAQRKIKKNVAKKDSRKRKNVTFADGRGRVKKRRSEEM
jgi:U3 small nucleolar RNA-associated protein 20